MLTCLASFTCSTCLIKFWATWPQSLQTTIPCLSNRSVQLRSEDVSLKYLSPVFCWGWPFILCHLFLVSLIENFHEDHILSAVCSSVACLDTTDASECVYILCYPGVRDQDTALYLSPSPVSFCVVWLWLGCLRCHYFLPPSQITDNLSSRSGGEREELLPWVYFLMPSTCLFRQEIKANKINAFPFVCFVLTKKVHFQLISNLSILSNANQKITARSI